MNIVYQDGKKRCFGGQPGKEFYAKYHDYEWGISVHYDNHLFEMLILEGAQAPYVSVVVAFRHSSCEKQGKAYKRVTSEIKAHLRSRILFESCPVFAKLYQRPVCKAR